MCDSVPDVPTGYYSLCVLSVGVDIGIGSDSVCTRHSSAHRIKSFESLASQSSLGRSSKLFHNQFRSLVSKTGVRTLNQPRRISIKIFHLHVRYIYITKVRGQ